MRRLFLLGSLLALGSGCGGKVGSEDFSSDAGDSALEDASVDTTFFDTSVDTGPRPDTAPGFDTTPSFDTSPSFDTAPGFDTAFDTTITFDTPTPDTSPPIDTGSFDTGSLDTGVVDTGFDAGGPLASCDAIATATCSPGLQACCTKLGYGWDFVGCSDTSHSWCKDAINGMTAGKTTYDGTYTDACAKAWAKNGSACGVPLVEWLKDYSACSHLFNGTTVAGGVCTRSSECKAGPGETSWCDEGSKRCRAYLVVGVGAPCNLAGSKVNLCDTGLTCDLTSFTPTCKKAIPVGGACSGPDSLECGLGYTCTGGKCAVGKGKGAKCTRDLECASWGCNVGTCSDPNATLASPYVCKGF